MRSWIDNVFLKGPLAEHRARCDIQRRRPEAKVDISEVSVLCSDGSEDTFVIRVYDPELEEKTSKQLRPAILMLHGGGWIHGKPCGDETISTLFASELGAVVLGVDYRLAPEHPFPAPLDDCSEAIAWAIRNAGKYQIDTSRIALWGASAGGNLAAAVSIRHTQQRPVTGFPNLRMVSLVVPVTAHPKAQDAFNKQRPCQTSSIEETVADVPLAPELVVKEFEKLYDLYVGKSTDIYDPLVSPLMAQAIAQHPKTHVTVAACDYLMPQGLAYAQLLRSFGTEVTEEILPGVPHGFTFPMNATVTKRWLENQRDIFMSAFGCADPDSR
ncbi:uncharacterized protein Z520_08780 [Fonsecaea multimorphosa CBS 102226]|uniref:Alpha/beta hydrolase fold-3 domain-containing protein n=1 Tax=Fonsecaea multimorphosa CBS 102226 TaxID=1442371 RepID=A0A0D2H1E0_9EURO|nr:uncharacterized protein Z520_08780 [Fonsecaea multimorphosa CBS 102226]KIX95660.1 hypothetical protein Z520_08780 [Fonsecaea multimorphosa CBS 102226]